MHRTFLKVGVLFIGCFFGVLYAEEKSQSENNASILVQLNKKILDEAIMKTSLSPSSSISVKINDPQKSMLFRQSSLEILKEHVYSLFLADSSTDTLVDVTLNSVDIKYGNPFFDGLFSSRKSERTISMNVSVTFVMTSLNKLLWTGTFFQSATDTIAFSSIKDYEDQSQPITLGKKVSAAFFDSILEPAIITIASGIAIYLFFTVRS